MDKAVAWVFPGQASQYPGMGKDFYDGWDCAKDVLNRCDEAFGGGLLDLMFKGPRESLTLTENAQPSILALSLAQAKVLEETGMAPGMVAGLSLGEYSALVMAGSISLEDGIALTRKRGRLMQEACPEGFGTMAAILGLSCADVESCCYDARDMGLVAPANYNSPGQIVISGKKEAVEKAASLATERGGTAIFLDVSAPFHCDYMESASKRFEEILGRLDIKRPKVPVFANVTGNIVSDPEDIRRSLREQMTSPVMWQTSVENMVSFGASFFVEVGPGKTLTGFAKRIAPEVPRVSFNSSKGLESVLRTYREAV